MYSLFLALYALFVVSRAITSFTLQYGRENVLTFTLQPTRSEHNTFTGRTTHLEYQVTIVTKKGTWKNEAGETWTTPIMLQGDLFYLGGTAAETLQFLGGTARQKWVHAKRATSVGVVGIAKKKVDSVTSIISDSAKSYLQTTLNNDNQLTLMHAYTTGETVHSDAVGDYDEVKLEQFKYTPPTASTAHDMDEDYYGYADDDTDDMEDIAQEIKQDYKKLLRLYYG